MRGLFFGELLEKMGLNEGRPKGSSLSTVSEKPKLADIGLSKDESSNFQKIGEMLNNIPLNKGASLTRFEVQTASVSPNRFEVQTGSVSPKLSDLGFCMRGLEFKPRGGSEEIWTAKS